MLTKIKNKIKNRSEIFILSLLILITIISTTYYNYTKNKISNNYKEIIDNVYFKKTINHFFDGLEPKFKKINHKILIGETFDSILDQYSINKKEVLDIKKKLREKINLNKLNSGQKIKFTIDQSDNSLKEFTLQISNKEKIILRRDLESKTFNREIIVTKLKKRFFTKKI